MSRTHQDVRTFFSLRPGGGGFSFLAVVSFLAATLFSKWVRSKTSFFMHWKHCTVFALVFLFLMLALFLVIAIVYVNVVVVICYCYCYCH